MWTARSPLAQLVTVAVSIVLMGCPAGGKTLVKNDLSIDNQTLPDSAADRAATADIRTDETPLPDVAPDLLSDTQPDLLSDTQPDLLPDTQPDLLSDTQPDLLSDAQPDLLSDTQPDLLSDAQPDLLSDTQPDLPPDAQADLPLDLPADVEIEIPSGCCLTDEDCNPDSFPDDFTHICVGFGLGAEPGFGVCLPDPAVGPQYLFPGLEYCWDESQCVDGTYCHGLAICGCMMDCDMGFEGPGFCAPEGEECVEIGEEWVQEICNAASLVIFDGDACVETCPGCCWCGPFCDFTYASIEECEAVCGASSQSTDPACPADGEGCGKAWGTAVIWMGDEGDPLPPPDPMLYDNVQVLAEKGDGTEVKTTTGPEGHYEMFLSPGQWTLTASPPNDNEFFDVFPSKIQAVIDVEAGLELMTDFEFWWQGDTADKPNIYLYPQGTTQVSVELQFKKGNFLLVSDPEYGTGWDVTVEPGGLIDGKYGFLFYEATVGPGFQMDQGHNVAAIDLEDWLLSALPAYGLNETETTDFVDFWCYNLPLAQWYRFYPQYEAVVSQQIGLKIVPQPDSLLRLWFVITPADGPANLTEPVIAPFNRQGFTAVEWGVVVGE